MKTIEERAIGAAMADTAKGRTREDYIISTMADHENGFREGYIQGATEQKAIDDRRYDFFKSRLINWCAAWMNDNPKGTMSSREWINALHKAMEE